MGSGADEFLFVRVFTAAEEISQQGLFFNRGWRKPVSELKQQSFRPPSILVALALRFRDLESRLFHCLMY